MFLMFKVHVLLYATKVAFDMNFDDKNMFRDLLFLAELAVYYYPPLQGGVFDVCRLSVAVQLGPVPPTSSWT